MTPEELEDAEHAVSARFVGMNSCGSVGFFLVGTRGAKIMLELNREQLTLMGDTIDGYLAEEGLK